jgi:hypothetical protein
MRKFTQTARQDSYDATTCMYHAPATLAGVAKSSVTPIILVPNAAVHRYLANTVISPDSEVLG